MANEKKPKKGLFAKIENRDDALKTIKDTSIASLVVAGIRGAIGVFLAPTVVSNVVLYAILGLILMKWKSRTAAVLLLLFSGLVTLVTVMDRLIAILGIGTNISLDLIVILDLIVLWAAVRAVEATFTLHGKPAVDKRRGITKIGLIVLVCVCLVIGCCNYSIVLHEQQQIKAKMTEVTYPMSNVASAITAYNEELNSWPHCDGVIAIQDSLGLSIPAKRISSITVTSPRTEEIIITATIKDIDSRVDGKNLTLTGKRSERDILWVWSGTVPSTYVPKR